MQDVRTELAGFMTLILIFLLGVLAEFISRLASDLVHKVIDKSGGEEI